MHGILYTDKDGNALSPLYSWQDERGNLPFENSTYAKVLSSRSGYTVATGYGTVSVFYDTVNGLIPENTASFCTIGDFVAMKLANCKAPVLNQTNASSLGLFDLEKGGWDRDAIINAGLPLSLFPKTTNMILEVGKTKDGVSVFTAIGDNQASVYGAENSPDTVIVNIGTGSQVSVITDEYCVSPSGLEIRPYLNGRYLLSGCALCGGYSYKLLKDFFNSVTGGNPQIDYDTMNDWAKDALKECLPTTTPLFRGTRANPDIRASITGLSETNFNAKALTLSTLNGISKELKDLYDQIVLITGKKSNLVGSGNAIRLNPVLREIIKSDYNADLKIPTHTEEAAFGVALIGAEQIEKTSLKKFVKYL
jgi:sedoheptulokinase